MRALIDPLADIWTRLKKGPAANGTKTARPVRVSFVCKDDAHEYYRQACGLINIRAVYPACGRDDKAEDSPPIYPKSQLGSFGSLFD